MYPLSVQGIITVHIVALEVGSRSKLIKTVLRKKIAYLMN